MKKGGVFLFVLFLCCSVLAQTEINALFRKDNPNIILQNEARSFKNQPLVYLEGVSDQPQPKTWQDKLKMRLFGSMEIPKKSNEPELDLNSSFLPSNHNTVEIHPSFGPQKQVAFIPHIADWTFVITPSDSNLADIYENMVFILTEKTDALIRDWPISSKDFRLLNAKIDQIPINLQPNEQYALIQLPSLTPGVHTLRLNYIVHMNKNRIPLIGKNWPLLADRFTGILFSNNINMNIPAFLVGTNAQEFPENFQIQKDKKGNIFFQLAKILPPKTQIQLDLKTQLPESKNSQTYLFFTISFGILLIYTFLSCIEIRLMSLDKKFKRFHLCSLNSFLNFIYRSGEICIGLILLLILTGIISFVASFSLSFTLWQILILGSFILIVFADYFVFYPAQKQIFQMRCHFTKEKK